MVNSRHLRVEEGDFPNHISPSLSNHSIGPDSPTPKLQESLIAPTWTSSCSAAQFLPLIDRMELEDDLATEKDP